MTDSSQSASKHADAADAMDRMYRWTRHVYDASRKYYLLGRDQLLHQLNAQPDQNILEIGCGTARNLIKLHRIAPRAKLFGLDASNEMLDTANRALTRANLNQHITLRQCLAEQLDHRKTFNLDQPFDLAFFSYSLSMIPTWPDAIEAALANIKPTGQIHIVDFYDQADLPTWFSNLLKWWLDKFHVHFRPELLDHLHQLEAADRIELHVQPIRRRYSYIATITPKT